MHTAILLGLVVARISIGYGQEYGRCYVKDLQNAIGLNITASNVTHNRQRLATVCNDGYQVKQSSTPWCVYGKWVDNVESPCQEAKCTVVPFSNGDLTKEKTVAQRFSWRQFNFTYKLVYEKVALGERIEGGETRRLSCKSGYSIQGHPDWNNLPLTCRRGKWTPNIQCLKTEWCRFSDIRFPGLVPVKSDFNNGESFAPSCEKGYKIVNTENMFTCSKGEWKALQLPPCKPEDCTNPPAPIHGKARSFTVSHGSHATFECNQFYKLEETSKLQCLFGKWEGQIPVCIDDAATCGPIIKPANSPLTIEPEQEFYQFGESVNFYCPFGQKLIPPIQSLLCLNGWLDLVVPECVII